MRTSVDRRWTSKGWGRQPSGLSSGRSYALAQPSQLSRQGTTGGRYELPKPARFARFVPGIPKKIQKIPKNSKKFSLRVVTQGLHFPGTCVLEARPAYCLAGSASSVGCPANTNRTTLRGCYGFDGGTEREGCVPRILDHRVKTIEETQLPTTATTAVWPSPPKKR